MTLTEFFARVDTLFADNIANGINPAGLREAIKSIGYQLRLDAATITAWSPVLAPRQNGPYIVMQIIDWTNGQGTKPAVGGYLASTGIVTDPNLAMDIRGGVGSQGLPGTGVVSAITSPSDGQPYWRYYPICELPAPSGGTFDFCDVELVGKPWDNGGGSHCHIRAYFANRGDFKSEYSVQGNPDGTGLVVSRTADNRAIVYARANNEFRVLSVRVTNYALATVYGALAPVSNTNGAVVFNSFDPANYPPLYRISAGGDLYANTVRMPLTTGNKKVALYDGTGNDHQFYGLGVNAGTLRYQVATQSDAHVFYAGATPASSAELARINGSGNLGLGTPTPSYRIDAVASNPLDGILAQFSNNVQGGNGAKIRMSLINYGFWDIGVGASVNALTFQGWNGSGISERARITQEGKLLVGYTSENNPVDLLQVNGSISGRYPSQNDNPTPAQVADGTWRIVRHTGLNQVRMWVNNGGTMQSILFQ